MLGHFSTPGLHLCRETLRKTYIARCHIIFVDMSEKRHIVYGYNKNTRGVKHARKHDTNILSDNDRSPLPHRVGMFCSLCSMVLNISQTLCPNNPHRSKGLMAHTQTDNSMRCQKVQRNKTRRQDRWIRMWMRI